MAATAPAKTQASAPDTRPVLHQPDVIAATEKLAAAKARQDAAVQRVSDLQQALMGGGLAAQEAAVEMDAARREVALADIQVRKGARERGEVIEAATTRTAAVLDVEHRRLLNDMYRALFAARPPVNAVRAFEFERQFVIGPSDALNQSRYAIAFNAIASSNAEYESLLDHSARCAREAGLLEDDVLALMAAAGIR